MFEHTFEVRVRLSLAGRVEAEGLGKHPPRANSSAEVRPMDSVMRKADELDRLVGELVSLDEQRVGIGTKLVELEHYFPQGRLPRVVAACARCLHDAVPGTRPRARRRDARISVDPKRVGLTAEP